MTFTTRNVEAMPSELAVYIDLAATIRAESEFRRSARIMIEPDWDGCAGRWANVDLGPGRWEVALCGWAFMNPRLAITTGATPERATPVLMADGWQLSRTIPDVDCEDETWFRPVPAHPTVAAEIVLRASLAAFPVFDPARWYITMQVFEDALLQPGQPIDEWFVDLRAWRRQAGLGALPKTIAPHGSEPAALLCDAGHHHLHAPPCTAGAQNGCID